jgi:hypothetical protein
LTQGQRPGAGPNATEAEANAVYTSAAIDSLLENPVRALTLVPRKMFELWGGHRHAVSHSTRKSERAIPGVLLDILPGPDPGLFGLAAIAGYRSLWHEATANALVGTAWGNPDGNIRGLECLSCHEFRFRALPRTTGTHSGNLCGKRDIHHLHQMEKTSLHTLGNYLGSHQLSLDSTNAFSPIPFSTQQLHTRPQQIRLYPVTTTGPRRTQSKVRVVTRFKIRFICAVSAE